MADLIINSGIQFISIPLNLREEISNKVKCRFSDKEIPVGNGESEYELKEILYWEEEEMFIDKNSINKEAYTHYGELNLKEINKNYVTKIDEEAIYSVLGKEAVDICSYQWIPLPYFRVRQDVEQPYHHGPE